MKATASLILGALAWAGSARGTHLTESRLQKVYDFMNTISTQSWENGTKAQAILEYTYPSLSVFSPTAPLPLPSPLATGTIPQIISIAQTTLQNRPATNTSSRNQGSTLLPDGAAADPASLGVAILLANAATNNGQVNGIGYGDAATDEVNYLLYNVPRTSSGAISHRADQAQLWSDFIYMVPPFLAYYAVLNNNQTLLQESYNQISLYRNTLRQSNGLWQHIVEGTGTYDPGLWATGNGWAAMGMLRVWATMRRSQYAGNFGNQMGDLTGWVQEIMNGLQGYATSDGLLRNYVDQSNTFEDAAGSAIVAAAALRLSTLNITNSYANFGTTLLSGVSNKVNSSGYLTQVTNPNDFSKQGDQSPEGQSFVLMGYAAYNEWVKLGSPGGNNGSDPLGAASMGERRIWLGGLGGGLVGLVAMVVAGIAML